jgi:hypothetical protein
MNNRRLSDIEIEIMRYAAGGMTGNKTYHQVRDQFMPMDSESMGYANGGGIGTMMKPKSKTGKAVNQLQAKAPEGEFLAYINPDEAAMLKRAGGSGEPVNGIPSFRPQDYGQEAASKKSGFNQQDTSNPYSQASKQAMASFNAGLGGGGGDPDGSGDIDSTYTKSSFDVTPKTKTGIFGGGGGFNPLAMILGLINPFLGIAARGIMGLKGGFKGFNEKMRGINPLTGEVNTQAEYEQDRYDRQQVKRLDKLFAAKDRGFNQIGFGDFTKKTMDFTPGQQSKIDQLMAQGYMPSTARNVDSGRGSGLRNTLAANNITKSMPNVNITGLNNNDYEGEIGAMNNNDFVGLNTNATDMQNYMTDQASFTQPGITPTNLNDFEGIRNIPQLNNNDYQLGTPQLNNNDFIGLNTNRGIPFTNAAAIRAMTQPVEAFKNTGPFTASGNTSPPSSPFTNQSYGIQDPYQQNYLLDQGRSITTDMYQSPNEGEVTASLPGNNIVAEITKADIDRFKQPMTQMMDFDTYKSINTESTLTPQEFEQLKAQV